MAVSAPQTAAEVNAGLPPGSLPRASGPLGKALDLAGAGLLESAARGSVWSPAPIPESQSREERAMTWEAPEFVEVKMDAEINSYQDDFDREPDDRF
jgi:coenzyme PQQ precursor peptide PqqA